MSFVGVGYLIWAIVVGFTRHVVNELSRVDALLGGSLEMPTVSRWLCGAFINAAFIWDLVGVLWLSITLSLILGSARQRWIISWPWVSGICHVMVAALLGAWAMFATIWPYSALALQSVPPAVREQPPSFPTTGWASLSIFLGIALVLWVLTLIWLLNDRERRGPSLRDGLRTNVGG